MWLACYLIHTFCELPIAQNPDPSDIVDLAVFTNEKLGVDEDVSHADVPMDDLASEDCRFVG